MAGRMRLSISFHDTSLTVADVVERRWWHRPRRYTAALYAGLSWIRDDTNELVDPEVAYDLEAARRTGLDIARKRL